MVKMITSITELKPFSTREKRIRSVGGFFINITGRVIAGVIAGLIIHHIAPTQELKVTPEGAAAIVGAVN